MKCQLPVIQINETPPCAHLVENETACLVDNEQAKDHLVRACNPGHEQVDGVDHICPLRPERGRLAAGKIRRQNPFFLVQKSTSKLIYLDVVFRRLSIFLSATCFGM
jgi:hypothetical protein